MSGKATDTYLVATIKPWNLNSYQRRTPDLPGTWTLVSQRESLTADLVARLRPRYVFFPHWSWRVPNDVLAAAECVCFHMTDLPYGRGGSPLQNLIQRGHKETVMSALRMTEELDAGPIYLKRPLSLRGSAQEIFERAAETVYDMIGCIVAEQPEPTAQVGEPTLFERRRPEQSELPDITDLGVLYDHIRMLDAEGYPNAYVTVGKLRFELRDASMDNDHVEAKVTIRVSKECKA